MDDLNDYLSGWHAAHAGLKAPSSTAGRDGVADALAELTGRTDIDSDPEDE